VRYPFGSPVIDAAARLLAPLVMLFAVYVVAHGHDSPGGGFQGGALFAGGLILIKLVRGNTEGWELGPRAALALACSGVLVFGGIGLLAVLAGGAYLDYSAIGLLANPVTERVLWTTGVEFGVALTVTGVILIIFDALAAWGETDA
jgi:multicomponent Na+:H+ antiporter subunit B